MDQQMLLTLVSRESGVPVTDCGSVLACALAFMGDALGKGEEIELCPAFGKFIPKWVDNPGRNANSPRLPKTAEYRVRFYPSRELEKKLRRDAHGDFTG